MAKVETREVILGVTKLAEELSVTRQTIYRTMQGTLNSARLRRELRVRGLHPAPYQSTRKLKKVKKLKTKTGVQK